jgi:hypothetical protein
MIFSIVLGAEYSFYVKSIATYVHPPPKKKTTKQNKKNIDIIIHS